jgi:hypothetical protein
MGFLPFYKRIHVLVNVVLDSLVSRFFQLKRSQTSTCQSEINNTYIERETHTHTILVFHLANVVNQSSIGFNFFL